MVVKTSALLDQRNRKVELEPFLFARQREANRMKQRFPFRAGLLADASRGGAERLFVR